MQRLQVDADGLATRAWKLAQDFWKHGRRLIPKALFESLDGAPSLIQVGLAEVQGDYVYVRGSSAYLDWMAEQREAAKRGGKKSAQRPRDSKGKLQKTSKVDPSETQDQPKVVQVSASSSASSSVSGSFSDSDSAALNLTAGPSAPRVSGKTNATWEAYSEAYKMRYREDPVRNAQVNSKLAQLVDRLGAEEAPLVAEFFLTHNDQYYVKKMHPVGALLQDAEKIRTEWKTGNRMLSATAVQVERAQHNSTVWAQAAINVAKRKDGTNG